MKALCILGSPKPDGNTAAILSETERALKESGVEVTRRCLGQSEINYCAGCKSCYRNGQCIYDDDVGVIVDDLLKADVIIAASPSYWGDVTGQMKVFIDRLTPYCNAHHSGFLKNSSVKGFAVAVRAGINKAENENLIRTIEHFLGHLNIPLISSFTAEGVDSAKDLTDRPEILSSAYEFGKNIVSLLSIV